MANATLRKMSDPMITAATIAQKTMTVDGMVSGKIAQPSTTSQMPDLTTISDQDLLSYINPSCFDQGMLIIFYMTPFLCLICGARKVDFTKRSIYFNFQFEWTAIIME